MVSFKGTGPSSSTTAALIAILSCITELLHTHTHVHCITFDYSKAFDTISHTSLVSKLACIQIPDNIHNWIINYLTGRTQSTRIGNQQSSPLPINAGIVQGSVLGPTLFNINSSDLLPMSNLNRYFKYADDGYLIVPASNSFTIPSELKHHAAWAASCNLKLNLTKTAELIFTNSRAKNVDPTLGIERVASMKILGVIVDNKLNFTEHIDATLNSCNQLLFALRTMRQHGLSNHCLNIVFKSAVISKLLYAAPCYWGFLSGPVIT